MLGGGGGDDEDDSLESDSDLVLPGAGGGGNKDTDDEEEDELEVNEQVRGGDQDTCGVVFTYESCSCRTCLLKKPCKYTLTLLRGQALT